MQFIEAANHWTGREGQKPRFIILHGTAGGTSAAAIANFFAGQPQDPNTGSSANYVIGTDGTVVQCVKDEDAPWANGPLTAGHDAFWDQIGGVNPNLVTIAIEHCKPSTDNSDQLTSAQQQASFQLVESLCEKWGVPKRWADANGGITGHYSLDPVNRSRCPGPYPWDALFSYLNRSSTQKEADMPLQVTDPFAAMYFKQSGVCQWYCASKKAHINGAILIYYCMIQGAPGLPEAEEQYTIKGVVWQQFERGIMVYDPQNLLKQTPPNAHNSTFMLMFNSPITQQILNAPIQDQLKKATDTATQALAAKKASDDKVLALGKEISELKAAQPVDQARLKTDLTNISAAVADAIKLVN